MATLDQIGAALKAADAAGNKEDAAALAREYARMSAAPAAPSAAATTATNPIDAAIRAAAGGASFNLADEIAAAGNATVPLDALTHPKGYVSTAPTWSQRYSENLAKERGTDAANAKAYPLTTVAGNVAGAIPLGMMVGAPSSLGGAALQGAGIGGAYGFGQGQGGILERLKQAALGAGTGAAMSGGIYKASDAINPIVSRISSLFGGSAKAKIPTTDELKDAARAAYKQVDNSGVQVSPDAINGMADSLQDKFGDRLDPILHPEATAVFNRVSQYATDGTKGTQPVSFTGLDNLRRVVADATQSQKPADRMLARQILDHVDDFVNNLTPSDLDTSLRDELRANLISATGAKGQIANQIKTIEQTKPGALAARGAAGAGTRDLYMNLHQQLPQAEDARQAAMNAFQDETNMINAGPQDTIDALNNARNLWSRAAKASTIQGLIDKAQTNASMFSGSGYENALRSQFRKLATNDRGMARFSPDEQAAIKQVATGGSPLSPVNILRQVGKLSPQGAVPLLAEIGGVAAGGPGMLAIPAAGLAGRAGATALTARNAQLASELARLGSIPAQPAPGAATQAIQTLLRRAAPASSVIPLSLMGANQ